MEYCSWVSRLIAESRSTFSSSSSRCTDPSWQWTSSFKISNKQRLELHKQRDYPRVIMYCHFRAAQPRYPLFLCITQLLEEVSETASHSLGVQLWLRKRHRCMPSLRRYSAWAQSIVRGASTNFCTGETERCYAEIAEGVKEGSYNATETRPAKSNSSCYLLLVSVSSNFFL